MNDYPGTRQTEDDGAYDHLRTGLLVPHIELPATIGGTADVAGDEAWTVLFLYPATGTPGEPLPDGWLDTPGAYGCTAETCGFRDARQAFDDLGVELRGISTQTPEEQAAFADREQVTFPLLSDHEHRLVDALDLPTFSTGGAPARLRRATLLIAPSRILHDVFYPIPDPPGHAAAVLDRLPSTVGDA